MFIWKVFKATISNLKSQKFLQVIVNFFLLFPAGKYPRAYVTKKSSFSYLFFKDIPPRCGIGDYRKPERVSQIFIDFYRRVHVTLTFKAFCWYFACSTEDTIHHEIVLFSYIERESMCITLGTAQWLKVAKSLLPLLLASSSSSSTQMAIVYVEAALDKRRGIKQERQRFNLDPSPPPQRRRCRKEIEKKGFG